MAKAIDPRPATPANAAESAVQEKTKLRLREDLLSQVGPKMAFYAQKSAKAGGGGLPLPGIPVAVEIPEVVLVAQVVDGAKFAKTLDKLMVLANAQLKETGPARRPPRRRARAGRRGRVPLEFKKVPGKGPGTTYTLTPPAGLLPPMGGLADIKPTFALGQVVPGLRHDARRGAGGPEAGGGHGARPLEGRRRLRGAGGQAPGEDDLPERQRPARDPAGADRQPAGPDPGRRRPDSGQGGHARRRGNPGRDGHPDQARPVEAPQGRGAFQPPLPGVPGRRRG